MNAPVTPPTAVPPYKHTPLFPLGKDTTTYRKITSAGVRVEKIMGRDMLVVEREALRALAEAAFIDISHLLRPAHLKSLKSIVEDSEAQRQRQVRRLRLSQERQHRGGRRAADVPGHRHRDHHGQEGTVCFTDGEDEAALAEGSRDAYLKKNLRYSQLAPLSMFEERNTANNMPAQVEIYAEG